MATIVEKKVLAALEDIYASNSNVITAIHSISVDVNNDDVVAKLQSILTATTTSNASLSSIFTAAGTSNSSLASILTSVNSNLKSAIQKASVARLSEILTAAIPALTPVRLFTANANRVGFCIYNNSAANSLYFGPTNSPAGARVFGQLAANTGPTALQIFLGPTVWTGEIWVYRNSGTGGVVGYELEP